jgi:hypothetical protein
MMPVISIKGNELTVESVGLLNVQQHFKFQLQRLRKYTAAQEAAFTVAIGYHGFWV